MLKRYTFLLYSLSSILSKNWKVCRTCFWRFCALVRLFVCVCVCVCARLCVRVCLCVCLDDNVDSTGGGDDNGSDNEMFSDPLAVHHQLHGSCFPADRLCGYHTGELCLPTVFH